MAKEVTACDKTKNIKHKTKHIVYIQSHAILDPFVTIFAHSIEVIELITALPLLTGQKVGKIGKPFPTFI